MMLVRLLPVILSAMLIAAHVVRRGHLFLAVGVLAMLPLLQVRRRWVPRVAQVVLLLATLEWLRTALVLAGERVSLGQPWVRMAVILGTVALVTAASALVFRRRAVRDWYGAARPARNEAAAE